MVFALRFSDQHHDDLLGALFLGSPPVFGLNLVAELQSSDTRWHEVALVVNCKESRVIVFVDGKQVPMCVWERGWVRAKRLGKPTLTICESQNRSWGCEGRTDAKSFLVGPGVRR